MNVSINDFVIICFGITIININLYNIKSFAFLLRTLDCFVYLFFSIRTSGSIFPVEDNMIFDFIDTELCRHHEIVFFLSLFKQNLLFLK